MKIITDKFDEAKQLVTRLSTLNPNAHFHLNFYPVIEVEGLDPEEAKCPDNYQYISPVGFTNRHNVPVDEYTEIPVKIL